MKYHCGYIIFANHLYSVYIWISFLTKFKTNCLALKSIKNISNIWEKWNILTIWNDKDIYESKWIEDAASKYVLIFASGSLLTWYNMNQF